MPDTQPPPVLPFTVAYLQALADKLGEQPTGDKPRGLTSRSAWPIIEELLTLRRRLSLVMQMHRTESYGRDRACAVCGTPSCDTFAAAAGTPVAIVGYARIVADLAAEIRAYVDRIGRGYDPQARRFLGRHLDVELAAHIASAGFYR